MLPSNLLRIKVRQGKIVPLFLDITAEGKAAELATVMTGIYRGGTGTSKLELKDAIKTLEAESKLDYRVVRGISTILERRSTFAFSSKIDPSRARMMVFEESSRRRALSEAQTKAVIVDIAGSIGVTYEELQESLFSDLDDRLMLKEFRDVTGEALLKHYNFSLLQTLLFRAIRINFSTSGKWKDIFREIKRLGLMYVIQKEGDGYKVFVEGPLSMFRMTDRYGASFVRLIAPVIGSDKWSIQAEILAKNRKNVYMLELSSQETAGILEDADPHTPTPTFDSSIEERFSKEFQTTGTRWRLIREPEPLIAGPNVMIPDFSLEMDGTRVFLEIVGFWTQEYLERKISKLSSLQRGTNMIVAVDEALACSRVSRIKIGPVIYFKGRVPVGQVIKLLEEFKEKSISKELETAKGAGTTFEGDMVDLREVAKGWGVSVETARRMVESSAPKGYTLTGDQLLSDRMMHELDREISGISKLSDALSLLEDAGVDNAYQVLEKLGYRISWAGLDLERSGISKGPAGREGS